MLIKNMRGKGISDLVTRKKIPIRKWLTFPALGVFILALAIVGSLLIKSSIENSILIIDELQAHMEEHVNQEIIQKFAMAEQLNQINRDMYKAGILNIESQKEREIYFSNILKSYPEAAMAFIGLPDGSFFGARRNPNGEIYVVRNDESTDGGSFYYSTDEHGEGSELEEKFPDFDPRTRPWYSAAVDGARAVHSEVYMHFVFEEPTITSSLPMYDNRGELAGVFGVNYLLSWLDGLLSNLLIGKNGHIIITDQAGMLLATTINAETYTINENGLSLINIKDSRNPYIKEVSKKFDENSEGRSSVKIGDRKYYTGLINLSKNNLNWKLHFLVAEDDFLGNIKTSIYYTLMLLVFFYS